MSKRNRWKTSNGRTPAVEAYDRNTPPTLSTKERRQLIADAVIGLRAYGFRILFQNDHLVTWEVTRRRFGFLKIYGKKTIGVDPYGRWYVPKADPDLAVMGRLDPARWRQDPAVWGKQ